jgi:hypothetical protein
LLTQQYVCVMCTLWSDNTCVFTHFHSANTQFIYSSDIYMYIVNKSMLYDNYTMSNITNACTWNHTSLFLSLASTMFFTYKILAVLKVETNFITRYIYTVCSIMESQTSCTCESSNNVCRFNFQYHGQFVDTDNITWWDQRKKCPIIL